MEVRPDRAVSGLGLGIYIYIYIYIYICIHIHIYIYMCFSSKRGLGLCGHVLPTRRVLQALQNKDCSVFVPSGPDGWVGFDQAFSFALEALNPKP